MRTEVKKTEMFQMYQRGIKSVEINTATLILKGIKASFFRYRLSGHGPRIKIRLYQSQNYILSLNYDAKEIHETKMTLICKHLTQGQMIFEMLEAIAWGDGGDNRFSLP